MENSPLRIQSLAFAKNIVLLCRELRQQNIEVVLLNQLIRCGTSIGANIYEAQYAQGSKDFISKLEIALKECYESEYWLELLLETHCISDMVFHTLRADCGNIRRMLIASCRTAKTTQIEKQSFENTK